MTRARFHLRMLAATAAFAMTTLVSFQAAAAWPNDQPIRLIVNFPPGGAADVIARQIMPSVAEAIGQSIVVENRAGAGGNIGGEAVAKAASDGYTLLFSSGGMVAVNPHIYPSMGFDPVKDLRPIAAAARVPVYLVANLDLPPNNVEEFIRYAKEQGSKLSYASAGTGSSLHLAGEMFNAATGVASVHVPYRGGAPAMVDLLGGQVHYMFDAGVSVPHVQSGKLKLLAIGSLQRSPLFPDTPTLDEAGIKGFDADTYFGLYAPAGVSDDIVERLNTEVNKVLETPEVQKRIIDMGSEAAPMSPQAFADKVKEDYERFGQLIRERNIKAE